MPLYEFRCPEHGVFEGIANVGTVAMTCPNPDCHMMGSKIMSATHFVMDGKMQTLHPHSPEGMQRTKELREKHTKNGTLQEWKEENIKRKNRDGEWTYGD